MTDGPFRNAELSSRWKRYGEDLVNDAASQGERTAQVCHSMLGDVDLREIGNILKDVRAYAQRPQMDLDPATFVEAIFDNHEKSPFSDHIQKHLIANIQDKMPLAKALDEALVSTVTDRIGITKNRLDEECILARDRGDLSQKDYRKGIERNREAFANINRAALCDALASGNGRAFRPSLRKKAGIDEGPDQ